MATIGDGFKDIFLAGVGAMAITGEKATVTAYDNSRLVTDHDPSRPDENPAYYQKKLRELYRKFAPTLALPDWKPQDQDPSRSR